ncbi:MAG TPA: iron export ABC transporter permease subunit FetB [Thermomicrobiales bacterium]|nr:iron export ABC transporter permease subunit FetB [Thermomicrobiales bacterium]
MNHILDISILQMALAFTYAVVLIVIVRLMGIPRELQIVVSSLRMTIQLVIAGYVLIFLFDQDSFWLILLVLAGMETFAVYNAIKRANMRLSLEMRQIIAIALPIGTLASLAFFLVVVVGGDAWRDPRYVIPLAGMIVGNAMTGVTLAVIRLVDGVRSHRGEIESALMLGATPRVATREIVRSAFDSAILPTINSMVGMGIVILPGMMTGQILSGTSPLIAIKYQIAIMLGIMGSVSFSVLILVEWGYRTFFNADVQLVVPAVDPQPKRKQR